MDRYWLLTNTCYGNWLPGEARGFVGRVRERRSLDPDPALRVAHELPGTVYDEDMPGLEHSVREKMKGPPIYLDTLHAEALLTQFRETAAHRKWEILAVAIMFNHFHIVVGVPGDPKPAKILGDFKSWATRLLTEQFGAPASETWWTERGSKRKLPNVAAIANAIRYVLYDQPRPLLTWSPETDLHFGAPPASVEV